MLITHFPGSGPGIIVMRAYFNFTTRSGTNQYHGSGYEYLQYFQPYGDQ
jgi:hypothetical protein